MIKMTFIFKTFICRNRFTVFIFLS